MAVEKLLGIEMQRTHQADPGADDGDQPDLLALGVAGHRRHGTRRADRDDQRLPGPRALPGRAGADHRPADEPRLRPSGWRRAGLARGRLRQDPRVDQARPTRRSPASTSCCAVRSIWVNRLKGVGWINVEGCLALGLTGPMLRAAGLPWDLRKTEPYLGYETYRLRRADRRRGRLLEPVRGQGRRDAREPADHQPGPGAVGADARAGSWSTTRRSPGRPSCPSARTAWATRPRTSTRS